MEAPETTVSRDVPQMLGVSVVIATYNRSQLLLRCLQSLESQEYPRTAFEVIVVDDGSADDTEEAVLQFKRATSLPRILYKRMPHVGPAEARNVGIAQSSEDIVVFIDDDAYAKGDWLPKLVDCFETQNVQAVEGAVLNTENGVLPFCHYTVNTNGGQYLTANMAFRKEVFRTVGTFDRQFRYAHAEDKELACRIIKAGGHIAFCREAAVYHPVRRVTYAEAVRKWRMFGDFLKLYALHPEMFKVMTGRRMPFFLLDTVFLIPMVDIKNWIGRLNTMRLRLKLFFFSLSKGLIRGREVLANLGYLWRGSIKHRKLRSSMTLAGR